MRSSVRPIFIQILAIVVLLGLFFVPVPQGGAYFGPPPTGLGKPFGGKVILEIDCDCPPKTSLLTIGSPAGGLFLKTPATKKFLIGDVDVGDWTVGLALPAPIPCLLSDQEVGCVIPVGAGLPITIVGSS